MTRQIINTKIIKKIKIVFFDFDGVFTDNRVLTDSSGLESVICNKYDSYGIKMMKEIGISSVILSSEKSKVIKVRAKKMKTICFNNLSNKKNKMISILQKNKLNTSNAAYVGNDLNDLECMKEVSLPIAIKGSPAEIKRISKYVTRRLGGDGAVREITDLIMNQNIKNEI